MIKVLTSGLYTTVQDLGRFGFRKQGVPVGGAMDLYSAELANRLVGNNPDYAILEITLVGPKLRFESDMRIAITGADLSPVLNGNPISLNASINVPHGAILEFGKANYGTRCYLAVAGGILTESVMGSRSFYSGITRSAKIEKGNAIPIGKPNMTDTSSHASVKVAMSHFTDDKIAVYPGPEFHVLPKEIQKKLGTLKFRIGSESNRMAYVLEADVSLSASGIITAPVQPGTVQLTPSGKLIVLMRDAQTTGGYARVLQLTEEAINKLAQKGAGERIQFSLKTS